MRVRSIASMVCAVVMAVVLAACGGHQPAPEVPNTPSPAKAVQGPQPQDHAAWQALWQDPERAEEFLWAYLGMLQQLTPGLTDQERSFKPVAVTADAPCTIITASDGQQLQIVVGPYAADPNSGVGTGAIGYCVQSKPRTILYNIDHMRVRLEANESSNILDVTQAFAAYMADPEARGLDLSRESDNVDQKVLGCVEGRIMHGLLAAGFIEDKFDLFNSPWEIKGDRRSAFDRAVAAGSC